MNYKLFYFLLGCTPQGRHTEQHDVFFCIATDAAGCIPFIKKFWPGPHKIHIDYWREVTRVAGYNITVAQQSNTTVQAQHLYFINLGGYLPASTEEHHYKLLTVAKSIQEAIASAKRTDFYKDYNIDDSAVSHIDNKYGVDIDEILMVKDILPAAQKMEFSIAITPATDDVKDISQLGYIPLNSLGN